MVVTLWLFFALFFALFLLVARKQLFFAVLLGPLCPASIGVLTVEEGDVLRKSPWHGVTLCVDRTQKVNYTQKVNC